MKNVNVAVTVMDGQAEDTWHINHILSFKDYFKK